MFFAPVVHIIKSIAIASGTVVVNYFVNVATVVVKTVYVFIALVEVFYLRSMAHMIWIIMAIILLTISTAMLFQKAVFLPSAILRLNIVY
jgi:hypothetical protein